MRLDDWMASRISVRASFLNSGGVIYQPPDPKPAASARSMLLSRSRFLLHVAHDTARNIVRRPYCHRAFRGGSGRFRPGMFFPSPVGFGPNRVGVAIDALFIRSWLI